MERSLQTRVWICFKLNTTVMRVYSDLQGSINSDSINSYLQGRLYHSVKSAKAKQHSVEFLPKFSKVISGIFISREQLLNRRKFIRIKFRKSLQKFQKCLIVILVWRDITTASATLVVVWPLLISCYTAAVL